jgi:hypothetical protein
MELVKPKYSTHASSIPTVTKVYISSLKKSGDNKRKEKKIKINWQFKSFIVMVRVYIAHPSGV